MDDRVEPLGLVENPAGSPGMAVRQCPSLSFV